METLVQRAAALAAKHTQTDDDAATEIMLHTAAPIEAKVDLALNALLAVQNRTATAAAQTADADYERASRLLIGTVIAAVLAAMALGFYMARSLAKPLKAMAAAASGMAAGDLDQTITLDRKDEVGQAAAGFRRAIGYLRGMAEVADVMADGDLTSHGRAAVRARRVA